MAEERRTLSGDIGKVRRNIKKMIDTGAPQEDIDKYLSYEDVSEKQLTKRRLTPDFDEWEKQNEAQLASSWRGILNVWEGIQQLFTPKNPERDKSIQEERELFARAKSQESPTTRRMMGTAEVVSEALPYVAGPAAVATAKLPARLTAGMAAGGGVLAGQFVEPGKDPAMTRAQRGIQGVFTGGAATLGLEPIRKLSSMAQPKNISAKEREILRLGEEAGVDLTYGDVRGGLATRGESILEDVPVVGLGQMRTRQQQQTQARAEDVSAKFSEPLSEAWQVQGQQSINSRLAALKRSDNSLYGKVASLTDPAGPVPVPKTIRLIDDMIAKEQKAVSPNAAVIKDLQSKKSDLYEAWTNSNGDFSRLRAFRSDLSDQVSEYYSGKNALIGKKGVRTYQQLRESLNQEMGTFAKRVSPDAFDAWKKADLFHKTRVTPFRESAMIRTLASEGDSVAVHRMFVAGLHSRPQTLYNSMGAKGRAAVKAGVVQDALEASTDLKTGFNPKQFSSILQKKQKEIGVFFRGADAQEMRGLIILMSHAQRAGLFAEKSHVQSRLVSLLAGIAVGTGVSINVPVTAASAVGIGMFSKFLSSKVGKEFLLSSSKGLPGPGMQKIIDHYSPRLAPLIKQDLEEAGLWESPFKRTELIH